MYTLPTLTILIITHAIMCLSLSHLFFFVQYMKAKKSSDVRVERSAVSGKLMKKKVKKSSKDKEVSEY